MAMVISRVGRSGDADAATIGDVRRCPPVVHPTSSALSATSSFLLAFSFFRHARDGFRSYEEKMKSGQAQPSKRGGEGVVRPPATTVDFESPSLAAPGGVEPAFELKFLLEPARAREVESWARGRLSLDPHGDPALGGAYRTTSLYFDTPELDVYHRSPSYKRRKFRLRRYGSAPWAFLERKSKWGDQVEKRRTAVPEGELPFLALPASLVSWPGHWFHRRLLMRRLLPACRVVYQRTAHVGACPEGPLRLTLDRRLHGILTGEWGLGPAEGGLPLLAGQVILELKFRRALPAPFKALVGDLRLTPTPVSKYGLCRRAWEAVAAPREAVDA
jgi:hypothetical protein